MTRRWKDPVGDERLLEAVRIVRDILKDGDIDYRLIGGLALELQGIETGTTDVDLLVDSETFAAACEALIDDEAVIAQYINDDAQRLDSKDGDVIVYEFPGGDGSVRSVAFFRVGDTEVDLLGGSAPPEQNAMNEIPLFSAHPRNVPVAPLAALVAIKLAAGRGKDIVHVEQVASALGKKRAQRIRRYLEDRDMGYLADEWDAAVLRATTPPRRRT